MYGHRDQSYSGERRERHLHNRGSSSHSRDRSRKQHGDRKDRAHGGHRSSSRRVSSGGGENESSSKRSTSGASDRSSGRRSSRDDRGHHSTTSDRSTERSSRASRSSASRSSSLDDLLVSHGGDNDLPTDVGTSSKRSKKTEEPGSSAGGFSGFILHEAISPPSEDFEGGSFKAGGFEICMPVTRSSSSDSATIIAHKRRTEELWGAVVQLGATPPETSPPRAPLWQKDWKPGPLTCSVPKSSNTLPVPSLSSMELSDK